MTACSEEPRADASAPPSRSGNFPVVEPFALDEAGSRLTVAFELPDGGTDGGLKSVFVGFRAVNAASDGSDEMLRNSMKVTDYLHTSALPVRIRLWRIEATGEQSVTLRDSHRDAATLKTWYEPHSDEVFTHHPAASTDNTPLINIGFYEADKAYYIHEFAQIVPPEPGRYRLEVESLESHPVLADLKQVLPDLKYELLVSHYYPR